MKLTEELKQLLERQDYTDLREIDGKVYGLRSFMFSIGLCVGITQSGIEGRYCYQKLSEAKKDLQNFIPGQDPKGEWLKYKSQTIEYSNPNAFQR